jgi:fibronectin-binding autotransporter adhesin
MRPICYPFLTKLISVLFCITALAVVAAAQQVSTWPSGSGNWSPCPQDGGNANWDTCKQDVYPNGNFDAVINGGSVTATAASIVGLEIDGGASLNVTPGYLQVTGNIANNGTITIGAGDGLRLTGVNTTTNLSGNGMVQMNDPNAEFIGANGDSLVVAQQIFGQGTILGMNSITNTSIISASGGTLEIYPGAGGLKNGGRILALAGSTLDLVGQLTWDNHSGAIESYDQSTVLLQTSIDGGTLVTSGSGNFTMSAPGGVSIGNLTNLGTFNVPTAATLGWNGTITNNGRFFLQGSVATSGNVTLKGTGSVLMNGGQFHGANSNPLLTQELIHGNGTFYEVPLTNQSIIRADSASAPLYIEGGTTTNTATLEATGGGTLQLDTVVNNSGGKIVAATGSTVIFTNNFNGSINGGTLESGGTGVIQSQNGVLDGTTNVPTNVGMLEVNNFYLFMQGTINNTGTIALIGNSCIALNQPTTLTGSGKVTMASSTCIYGSGIPFTNQSTIQGAGSIGDSNPMPITNSGTILANQTAPLLIAPNAAGFTNSGKLIANAGSTLDINGPFNNLNAAGTLTGGSYTVAGTLGLPNSIVTNAANLTLTGSAAQVLYDGSNAFAMLAANSSSGSLSLQKGAAIGTSANLNNSGQLTIGSGSTLKSSGVFSQTAGTSTIDGTLIASKGMNLKGGTLFGGGTLRGSALLSGLLVVGDSISKPTKLAVTGSYQQNANGSVYVGIGGSQAGSQYSQLTVSNGMSLGGILNIKLLNGFVPNIGDTFTILTGGAVSGQFSQVNGTIINASEMFQVNYGATSVTLTVVGGN